VADDLRAAGLRVRLDDRTDTGFGRRAVAWELKGVPARVEVGPRDLEQGQVTVVSRHQRTKSTVPLGGAVAAVTELLARAGDDLRGEAAAWLDGNTETVSSVEEAVEVGAQGFARVPWSLVGDEGEDRLAREALSVRCLQRPDGSLPAEADDDSLVAVVGRSY
jgi:prolyl-tRNA synthetase